jgi:NTP pyrophosphatase (non-canonical NTP hydrolase)
VIKEELNPWEPTTSKIDLKILGKLGEELGELSAAVSRCIIQGIDEAEPTTGKINRQWLEEEIADVHAGLVIILEHYKLNNLFILNRSVQKINTLRAWHKM